MTFGRRTRRALAPYTGPMPGDGGTQGASVAVFFVASPFHLLCALQVCTKLPADCRKVLVTYKRSVEAAVRPEQFDVWVRMPWPRFEPLPGPLGGHRRLVANLHEVAEAIGPAREVLLHSPVYDTEAINYFVNGLPRLIPGVSVRAFLIPDGALNLSFHRMSPSKRMWARLRSLRAILSPVLRYAALGQDRTGSDASFVEGIYVIEGLDHPYPVSRTIPLSLQRPIGATPLPHRALIVGQHIHRVGWIDNQGRDAITATIRQWLEANGVTHMDYKAHPDDPFSELCTPDYNQLEPATPLEDLLDRGQYGVIIGVASSAQVTAKLILGDQARVMTVGYDLLTGMKKHEFDALKRAFAQLGVESVPVHPASPASEGID